MRPLADVLNACLNVIDDKEARREIEGALSPVFDSIPFTAPEAMHLRWERATNILNHSFAGIDTPPAWMWTMQSIYVGQTDYRAYLPKEAESGTE